MSCCRADKGIYAYHVYAWVDGSDVPLVKAENEDMARFIETWLEDQLKIVDDGVDAVVGPA